MHETNKPYNYANAISHTENNMYRMIHLTTDPLKLRADTHRHFNCREVCLAGQQ